jgi:hypothetical protein
MYKTKIVVFDIQFKKYFCNKEGENRQATHEAKN